MPKFFKFSRVQTLLLLITVCVLLVACRTLDLVLGYPVPPASVLFANAQLPATDEPIQESSSVTHPPIPAQEPTVAFLFDAAPTDEPQSFPTDPPPPTEDFFFDEPTDTPNDPVESRPQPTPTDSGPLPTPEPTRCPQQYCVVYHGCQPDAGNTVIEGVVYNNGVPENGVVVRVAKEPGAYPLVDDFVSGNSAINPGQPDPNTPGHYLLQIVAGEPCEGNWWVFVVDKVNGTRQLSEAKLIHTNDDPFNPVNCQHAFVDFVR